MGKSRGNNGSTGGQAAAKAAVVANKNKEHPSSTIASSSSVFTEITSMASDPIFLHTFYITLIAALLFLLLNAASRESTTSLGKNKQCPLVKEKICPKATVTVKEEIREVLDRSSYDYEFKVNEEVGKENEKYFDIPPDIFHNRLLRVWKWKSRLSIQQCDSFWKTAEELNDYGEYSKFGDEFPTLDVSLEKFPRHMNKAIDLMMTGLVDFITDKFIPKLDIDGHEMKFTNGSLYFGDNIEYQQFLQFKGPPFVIKYDASGGKTAKLRTHKDNSDVSFILLVNKPTDFGDGGTYFHAINKTLYLDQGEALIFNGQLVHEAIPISHGKRFVVSGFIKFSDEFMKMKTLGTMATTPHFL